MTRLFFLLIAAAVVIAFKSKSDTDKRIIKKGEVGVFQKGKAWTWVETDKNKKPLRVGISVDDAAMNTLDKGMGMPMDMTVIQDMGTNELSVAFPKVEGLPFVHALIGWNPDGHEPAGIYDKPHFDFHFYTTTEEERLAIPVYKQDSAKFKSFPANGYLPGKYVPAPGGIPQMGAHWIDVATGELNGKGFTETFLYGSFDGKLTFYEPMITKEFLDTHPSYQRSFPVPTKFAKDGYYPTKMSIERIPGETRIILTDFVYQKQS